MTVGSVCSGIEAASVAWAELGVHFSWLSEIAPFPVKFLAKRYPDIPNEGDLCMLPEKLRMNKIPCVDIICGGTPCQAFSLSGHKRGLEDERGRLTLKFIEAVDANDERRENGGTIVFWENVEGVLKDKTNAFGCFVASLAGCSEIMDVGRWPNAGLIRGRKRNVAWRILDAKYFGLPQQRRRLYVLAGGKDFNPERILFERHQKSFRSFPSTPLVFVKDGKRFELFREYTDCLYSAYGTKWNGNAAAYNGSLFVLEDERLRRFTPLECERLMGFPDNYTQIERASSTNRYQGVGNSWAVPVVRWLGKRILKKRELPPLELDGQFATLTRTSIFADGTVFYDFSDELIQFDSGDVVNASEKPEEIVPYDLTSCIDTNAEEKFFISPVGCKGILRRKTERGVRINSRLEKALTRISSQMTEEVIETLSRRQRRGAISTNRIESVVR